LALLSLIRLTLGIIYLGSRVCFPVSSRLHSRTAGLFAVWGGRSVFLQSAGPTSCPRRRPCGRAASRASSQGRVSACSEKRVWLWATAGAVRYLPSFVVLGSPFQAILQRTGCLLHPAFVWRLEGGSCSVLHEFSLFTSRWAQS